MNPRALTALLVASLLMTSLAAATAAQADPAPVADAAKAKKKKKKKRKRVQPQQQPVAANPIAPPPTCADDSVEPNDTIAEATFLSRTDPIASRLLCPGDPDLHRVTVEPGYLIRVTVDPEVFNAKLEVFDGNGNPWGTLDEYGPGVAEFIEFDHTYGQATGNYYVDAAATTIDAGGAYTIKAVAVLAP